MRVTALVLGVVGGVVGLFGASRTLQLGQLGQFFGAAGSQALVGSAVLAMVFSIVGIVGGGLALNRPRSASILMTVAAVGGLLLVRSAYLIATAVLAAGAILAWMSPRPVSSGGPSSPAFVASPNRTTTSPTSIRAQNIVPPARTFDTVASPRSVWIARGAWALALVVTLITWWFWIVAILVLFACALIAWIPKMGDLALRAIGWRYLPWIGAHRGFRASGLLVAMVVLVVLAAVSFAPRPPQN